MLRFSINGGIIYYYLRTDDYTGLIPVEIKYHKEPDNILEELMYFSLSDIPSAQVYGRLEECDFNDFKFYKAFDLQKEII